MYQQRIYFRYHPRNLLVYMYILCINFQGFCLGDGRDEERSLRELDGQSWAFVRFTPRKLAGCSWKSFKLRYGMWICMIVDIPNFQNIFQNIKIIETYYELELFVFISNPCPVLSCVNTNIVIFVKQYLNLITLHVWIIRGRQMIYIHRVFTASWFFRLLPRVPIIIAWQMLVFYRLFRCFMLQIGLVIVVGHHRTRQRINVVGVGVRLRFLGGDKCCLR